MFTIFDLMQAGTVIALAPWNAWRNQCGVAYDERYPNWWLADMGKMEGTPAICGC